MRPRSLLALTLAAAFASPVSAGVSFTPSETSVISSAIVVLAPFSIVSAAGGALSEAASSETLEREREWQVAAVQAQGDKTALTLRSADKSLRLETTIATTTARAQAVKVNDRLAVQAIGKSGYALKKGETTIGILTTPGSGMVHSKARA